MILKPGLPLYQIVPTTPRPVHSLSPAGSADGYTFQGDAPPELKLHPGAARPSTQKGLPCWPSGSGAGSFRVRTAWNTDEDVRRPLATQHLHSVFEF